ncbi:MAG TPA: hypothetical protein VGR02_18670 [Thermoanaerobaculia bacterium]|jgi:hypothetical protein|nr:hypothetical protein [Thermoanaerobaculia bacterium]
MKKLIVIVLLAVACGGNNERKPPAKPSTPPTPAAAAAKELIASSPEFGDYQFTDAAVTIPITRGAMNEPARKIAEALVKGGWLGWSGGRLVVKKTDDKRFLVRPNGTLDVVPLAKKELGAVKAVNGEKVDFTWRWVPNEIGKALRFDEKEQQATATLYWDGSRWAVLSIIRSGSGPAS